MEQIHLRNWTQKSSGKARQKEKTAHLSILLPISYLSELKYLCLKYWYCYRLRAFRILLYRAVPSTVIWIYYFSCNNKYFIFECLQKKTNYLLEDPRFVHQVQKGDMDALPEGDDISIQGTFCFFLWKLKVENGPWSLQILIDTFCWILLNKYIMPTKREQPWNTIIMILDA